MFYTFVIKLDPILHKENKEDIIHITKTSPLEKGYIKSYKFIVIELPCKNAYKNLNFTEWFLYTKNKKTKREIGR